LGLNHRKTGRKIKKTIMKHLTWKFRSRRFSLFLAATLVLAAMIASGALAVVATCINWTGQGVTCEGGNCVLNKEVCTDPEGNPTGPYLLWVLTANGATSATITINGVSYPMEKVGGTFKYRSDWYDLNTVQASACYEGTIKNGNPQFVISHGCPPAELQACSPGFWKNHPDAYTDASFNAVFGPPSLVLDPWNLSDALDNPGNPPSAPRPNPCNANFVGTAAYLSAIDPNVNYQYSVAFIINAVQAAHSGDCTNVQALAATFGPDHVCPLGESSTP
jgi:hypothetical protein